MGALPQCQRCHQPQRSHTTRSASGSALAAAAAVIMRWRRQRSCQQTREHEWEAGSRSSDATRLHTAAAAFQRRRQIAAERRHVQTQQ
jgi:hypothetical protein